ncbi:MAG: GDP-mannose 4,6-dehydratase [Candidatus Nanoarchaeia archaeon]|nr:GDP-mannose 4,6-dehydratase [Candidatus Nanoarchaeia archaeon]MDD5239267.1 GDP-mannose 4,6-dehydratase [Candidatus Nanoarchaeia archaeon]
MKKVLITGVTGFIGSHLAQALSKKKEYAVYGLVKHSASRNTEGLKPFLKDIRIKECDISDFHSVSRTLREINPDVVVHLAALSPVRDSFESPISYVQANIIGTLNIAHALTETPNFENKKMIYASTAEVYGILNDKKPANESRELYPSSPYAATKKMTDEYIRLLMPLLYKLNTTVMRCVNSYGRKLDTSFMVEYLVTTMLKGEKVYVGAPDSLRDYMYVDDHVNAYIKAIEHPEIRGEAFNVSTGTVLSNKELAFKIADIIGYDKKMIVLGQYPPGYPSRPLQSDQPFINLDSSKIRKKMGWAHTVELDEGLKRTVAYWKEKLNV